MRLLDVEKKARIKGIVNTWRFTKTDLIRAIQRKEGFSECFATPTRVGCNQMNCCWRSDCIT